MTKNKSLDIAAKKLTKILVNHLSKLPAWKARRILNQFHDRMEKERLKWN